MTNLRSTKKSTLGRIRTLDWRRVGIFRSVHLSYKGKFAPPEGFEPSTLRVETACSVQAELRGHGGLLYIRLNGERFKHTLFQPVRQGCGECFGRSYTHGSRFRSALCLGRSLLCFCHDHTFHLHALWFESKFGLGGPRT